MCATLVSVAIILAALILLARQGTGTTPRLEKLATKAAIAVKLSLLQVIL